MYAQLGPVTMKVIDLQRYERTVVNTEDGMDIEGVEHTLGFVAVYAPGGLPPMVSATRLSLGTEARLDGADVTARNLRADGRGVAPVYVDPQLEKGPGMEPAASQFAGPQTDAELYPLLMRHRQKFILWAYDRQTGNPIRWLESPRPGFSADARGGPFVLGCDVVAHAGEPHSIAVYLQVQTFLPACPMGTDRFILSHRWETSHTHDDDNYLTRVVEGTIRFHAGVRDLLGLNPDAVRRALMHPIPLGFERKVPLIKASSDGLTLRYTIRDTNPTIVFSAGDSGCTQIQIAERFEYTAPYQEVAGGSY